MATDIRNFQLVTLRTERRKQVFHTNRDYYYFLGLIKRLNSQFTIECHAYSLMSNHVKLMISGYNQMHVTQYLQTLKLQFNNWSKRHYPDRQAIFAHHCSAQIATAYDQILCMLRVELSQAYTTDHHLHRSEIPYSSHRHNSDGGASYMLSNCPGYEGLGVDDQDRRQRYRELANNETTHDSFSRIDYQQHAQETIDYRAPISSAKAVRSADIRYLDR